MTLEKARNESLLSVDITQQAILLCKSLYVTTKLQKYKYTLFQTFSS